METLKEIISKRLKERSISAKKMCEDIEITEQALYSMYRNNSGSTKTLNKINEYLGLELSKSFSQGSAINLTELNNSVDSMLIEYLKKENEFLKGFIKEKLAINFNNGGLMPTYGTVFFGANNP
ncbi:helix-turn-helix transcriptional regulator [Emticicia sp. W12TSBA100-4]|uniref:helix-turn-helix domain-containing protein n=1 Tax=Emticicia sp. W12TSBA100-4 TaxID=3160965 RepID=UPI003305CC38